MPVVLTLAVTLALWLSLRRFSGNGSRAALATSLLIALFFAFNPGLVIVGTFLEELSRFWVHRGYRERPLLVLTLLGFGGAAALDLIFRRMKNPVRWSSYLNLFALILVLQPSSKVALARIREPAKPIIRTEGGFPLSGTPGRLPDIYYIILDAYARSDVMNELFDFDNAPFLSRLEQKGFFVARDSRSNYCQTTLSLCSTLNCDYINKLIDPSTRDLGALSSLIRDNLVVKTLRPLGYKFVAFASGYDFTECTEADQFLGPRHPANNFQMLLISMTPLRHLPFNLEEWDFYRSDRERTLCVLETLPEITSDPGPTFTFAHIMAPHHPFVFGENGEDVSPRTRSPFATSGKADRNSANSKNYREGYRKQAIFLTKRVEQTIDRILAESPRPPIIILQSDHGSGLRHHLNDLESTDLRERMSILNCYYFPNRDYKTLTPRMTPVNSFRIVFNNNFGTELPLLDNRNLFSTYDNPAEFFDVTGRLDSERDRGREYHPPEFFPGMVH